MFSSGGALLWRRGVLLLMLTNKGWVDGNGSNPGGGLGKPRGGRETRGGEDGLKGPGGQLSMVVVQHGLVSKTHLVMMKRGTLLWRRGVLLLMLTNKGWVDGNGLIPSGGFEKLGGGQETHGGGDGLKGPENAQPFNLAYFIIKRMYFFRDRRDKVLPYGMILTRLFKDLKPNMAQGSFDECYKLVPRKMSSLKVKKPKIPPPKRTRNVGKSKRTQLTTSFSTESPLSDNGDLPSTKLSPRSYHRALKDDPNMSKEQRETRGMFKNLGRALHNFARMLKKGFR
nr:hypothetical protein [Tanacetum cinerariifolium]